MSESLGATRSGTTAFGAALRSMRLAINLENTAGVPPEVAARAVVEGVLLARYRYDPFHSEPSTVPLAALTLVVGDERTDAVRRGAEQGRLMADACMLTRDLGNAPASYLTAERMAEVAERVAGSHGLQVEVFDRQALIDLGCGGLLGVNAGSTLEPRMIKLMYRPPSGSGGRLSLVGKGIMYDSGGINLKPGDAMHLLMKHDMDGAGAVLGAMSALAALECPTTVTGYLMCTDNMPSGSAMKMGDVLRIHGGQDGGGPEHRCRRPVSHGGRARADHGAGPARRHRGHCHADRRCPSGAGNETGSGGRQQPGTGRPDRSGWRADR
jgi:leucyl aminopeptidase